MVADKLEKQLRRLLKELERINKNRPLIKQIAEGKYTLVKEIGESLPGLREELRDIIMSWGPRKVTIGCLDCESLVDIRDNHDFLYLKQRFDFPEKGIKTQVLNGDETYSTDRIVMYEQTPVKSGCGGVAVPFFTRGKITTFAVIAVRNQIKKMLGDLAKICASDTCSISIQSINAKSKKKKEKEGVEEVCSSSGQA